MAEQDFAIAVFPFLKTSAPIRIGGYIFRSTDDLGDLPEDQATAVRDIREMLFVHSDLRVKSASFAIIPGLEVHSGDTRLQQLEILRDVVAYFYSSPHEIFDTVFLHPEEVSLALIRPDRVSVHLARPEHHTESVRAVRGAEPDQFTNVPGYRGLYNFRHAFWLERGGRLYGPKPHMTLNIAQDLQADIFHGFSQQSPILLELLEKPLTAATARVFNALRWYNAANEERVEESRAILNLAVAFEALLRLPKSEKTERLVDAISLLLGRTERLEEWAEQFYAARSSAAHEGIANQRYFFAGHGANKKQLTSVSGSLMLYGRQIFQLCVDTLLVGIDLAHRANLEEKFVTNNERFQKIRVALEAQNKAPADKLLGIAPIVEALERYRFVATAVDTSVLLGAARLSAATLLACQLDLPSELQASLAAFANSKRDEHDFGRLSALSGLIDTMEKAALSGLAGETRPAVELIRLVWANLFPRYFHLKAVKDQAGAQTTGG